MDNVYLTRSQIKVLAKLDKDMVVTATNEDMGLIFVEPTQYIGAGKGKWMTANGSYRKD